MTVVRYLCTKDTLQPVYSSGIRQINPRENIESIYRFTGSLGSEAVSLDQLTGALPDNDEWLEFVLPENRDVPLNESRIISRAAIWKNEAASWEVAAVGTLPEYRGRGLATMLVSHCAEQIIAAGKFATCSTMEDNTPMRRVCEKLGFIEERG